VARVARQHLLVRRDRALQEPALAEVGGEIGEAQRALIAVEIAAQSRLWCSRIARPMSPRVR
jgi:hypothetical protein